MKYLANSYKYLLDRPKLLFLGFAIVTALLLPGIRHFSFDASADTLVVQGDPELTFYREVLAKFGGNEFMLMVVTAKSGNIFEPEALNLIATLETELEKLKGVRGVLSILDVPLLKSPLVHFTELVDNIKTLGEGKVDLALARDELLSSPLFKDLLVSKDGASTALRIDLDVESQLEALRVRRDELRESGANKDALQDVTRKHAKAREALIEKRSKLMSDVRTVRAAYSDQAEIRLGGVPMIAADMIQFVKDDIVWFGSAIALIMIFILYGFFRRIIWLALPLMSAVLTNLLLIGFLGYIGQMATVISSNFVALLAITSISLNIHLIIRYRELADTMTGQNHRAIVIETLYSKFAPCAYTAITTMVAFGSLILSRILPVEDFGWIMVAGIAFSMFVAFTFFPAVLLLLPKVSAPETKKHYSAISELANQSIRNWRRLVGASLVLAGLATFGLTLLNLDNRFIDYFRESTDIHQGLLFIDQNLGGTTPFDVIVQFPPWQTESEDNDFEDDFEDDFDSSEAEIFPQKYWFTPDKIKRLGALHDYIDKNPGTGKTLSLATLELVARDFNDGRPLSSLALIAILDAVPDDLRAEFIKPYADPDAGLMRISSRLVESGPFFSRNDFISDIAVYAESIGFKPGEVRTTGVMVMFNDMLNQLLASQTNTIIFVVLSVLLMFMLCIRNFKLSVLGVIPNLLSAAIVLSIMGYVGLPLDMMTITIAAISLGIGVDDAIHYLHRYCQEKSAGKTTAEAIRRAHAGVGVAMYFTSVTVMAGFLSLVLSNFIPNVTFGILIALAMLLALLANLGLLPALIMAFARDKDPAQS